MIRIRRKKRVPVELIQAFTLQKGIYWKDIDIHNAALYGNDMIWVGRVVDMTYLKRKPTQRETALNLSGWVSRIMYLNPPRLWGGGLSYLKTK